MSNSNVTRPRWATLLSLVVAIVLLNAALTFRNLWPTPYVHWVGELSVEVAVILLLLATWQRSRGPPPRWLRVTLAILLVIGTLGHYGEVTAPALYGRDVNLFWDLPHVSSLAGMVVKAVPVWMLLAIVIGLFALFALLYGLAAWSLRSVTRALALPRANAIVGISSAVLICWFALQRANDTLAAHAPQFSMPVAQTYGTQFVRTAEAIGGRTLTTKLPRSPAFVATLSQTRSNDVMVVFLESYGRVTYDRPEFFRSLANVRSGLSQAASDTGRNIVSGFVESPTFGGGSWLAHLSFLSGIEVRDAKIGQLLMTQHRETLVTEFSKHGYRTVALMPGLKSAWPEGSFYGFDKIYDDPGLDYHGPAFGWWRIPDQFSLAELDAVETVSSMTAPRAPLFTVFPTISLHAPFSPTPPYQSDWTRLKGGQPFDTVSLQQSLAQRPNWNDMSPGYVRAVKYSLATLAGYLRQRENRDLIMIVLGDHQPPAFVSGEHASWDVPVHVITRNVAVLDALRKRGFVDGMIPRQHTLEKMHQLGPTLLAAFDAQDDTQRVSQLRD